MRLLHVPEIKQQILINFTTFKKGQKNTRLELFIITKYFCILKSFNTNIMQVFRIQNNGF